MPFQLWKMASTEWSYTSVRGKEICHVQLSTRSNMLIEIKEERNLLCLLEKIMPSTIQHSVNIYSCQRHCFAISSSSIWVACCLDLSSRLVLLASKLRRARSSSGLALWKSPLRTILGGFWGRVCWLPAATWGLYLQYSVQMRSLSLTSIACKGLENKFTAKIPVTYGPNKLT